MKKQLKIYFYAFLLSIFAIPISSIAQHIINDAHPKECRCTQEHNAYWKENPKAKQKYLQEQVIQKALIDNLKAQSRQKGYTKAQKYIIPVVFHIFGDVQGGKDITYELIENALAQTNDDYAKRSTGQDDIHSRFQAVVGDIDIEFRLAKKEPNGNICDGVNFYPASFYPDQSGFGNGSGYDSKIQQYAWDNYKYMNVYITNDLYDDEDLYNSGVSWYPSTSMSDNNLARVVFNGAFIGTNGSENFRRILTHEFGHFFNLMHTFEGGCPEKDGGDQCDDTPATDKSNMGINELNCNNEYTNTQNFMNYSDDYEMFTIDQMLRYTAALDHNTRKPLWQPDNLIATGVNDGFDPGMVVTYDVFNIKEAIINDGSVVAELNISLTAGAEFANAVFAEGTHFNVTNIPTGLSIEIARTDATNAVLRFKGKAANNEKEHSVKNITIEFLQPAFTTPIAQVNNTKVDKIMIQFRSVYETKYISLDDLKVDDSDTFGWFYLGEGDSEFGGWKCSIDELPNVKFKFETYSKGIICQDGTENTANLKYGDTIGSTSSWFAYDNYPNQPNIYSTDYTNWLGNRAYIGIQFQNLGDTYNGWVEASLSADGSALTLHDAAYYTKPNATLLAGQAHEAMLKFNGDSILEDIVNNNGSMYNILTAKLLNSTFTVGANTIIEKDVHYTIVGLPVGLTEEIKVLENNRISIELKGYAESHNKANTTDIVIEFKDALYNGLTAAEIKDASQLNVELIFINEYKIIYADISDITVNKDNTWKSFNLGNSDYEFGAWFNDNLLRFETYEKDVICYEGMLNAKPLNKGDEIGLNSETWVKPGEYPDEIYITDTDFTEWYGKEAYLGCVIKRYGLTCYAWIRIAVDTEGKSYTVKDWAYNEQPNSPIIAGKITKINQITLGISNAKFLEYYKNDGSVDGSSNITILNDEFAFEKGSILTQGTHFNVKNLPEGLRCQLEVIDDNNIKLTLVGNAIANTRAQDAIATLSFKDLVFATSTTATVENNILNFEVKFKEPWDIIYTDIKDITTNKDNKFTWFGMDVGDDGFGAWWYNKDGRMKLETYENYIVCHKGTSNLIPLLEGTIIGDNSQEWYQGNKWPNEPDLNNNSFNEWLGKEAYVGVAMKDGDFWHYGWIRIKVAADAMSYTVLDHAYNDQPDAPILAGQKIVGEKSIIDITNNIYKETYENDGSVQGENIITVLNGKFSLSSGLLEKDTHYDVQNLPEGLVVEITAINTDSLKIKLVANATDHLAINDIDFNVSLKPAAFEDPNKEVLFGNFNFNLNFRDVYSIKYVDNTDVVCTKDNTWTDFEIIPGLNGVGAWCNNDINFKMESYDNKLICENGTSQIKLLEGNTILDKNTITWTTYDEYPNQLDVYNNSYTDWKGKEGYVGVQLIDQGYYFYAWLRISVAADGKSYSILDYAYNEKPNEPILTGAKQFVPIKPEVDFTSDKFSIFKSQTVTYTDLSKYEPNAWSWSFDGGEPLTSTAQNPVVDYLEEGVYNVSLTATNKDGSTSLTKSEFITVYEEGPAIASFKYDNTFVKTGEAVQFTDASLYIPTSWKWAFEGGTPANSTEQNPNISYNTPGVYTVSLVAANSFGQTQEVKEALITVEEFSPNGYCAAKHVYDGNWLDIKNVNLAEINNASGLTEYSDFTNQIAKLTVDNSYDMGVSYGNNNWGSNSLFVWIDWNQDKTLEASERVFFGDNSSGDSFHSFQITVPSDAAEGLTLMRIRTAYSSNCDPCGTITYAGETEDYTIQISAAALPIANFIANKTTIAKGENILFADASQNNPTSWAWEFEGAETLTSDKASLYVQYNTAGTYQVKLTVTNDNGSNIKTAPAYITVTETAETPEPEFLAEVTAINSGDEISFTNLTAYNKDATYLWTFEGGEPASSSKVNPEIAYFFQGEYGVTLSVTTPAGTKQITKNALIKVSEAHKPVAEFKSDKTICLEGGLIQFTDLSANEPTSWAWVFEGGTPATSNDQNPSVTYATAGTYKVSLVATNDYGVSDANEKLAYLTVQASNTYCTPSSKEAGYWERINSVQINDLSNEGEIDAAITYRDYSNLTATVIQGGTATLTVTTKDDRIRLSVFIDWDQDGTFASSEKVSEDQVTAGGTTAIDIAIPIDAVLGYTRIRIRTRNFDPVASACSDETTNGETEDYTLIVSEAPAPKAIFTVTNTELEKGKSIIFSHSSEGNPTSVLWTFEGGTPPTSTEDNPVVSYSTVGNYDVSLIVTNADGNNTELKTEYITVIEPAANHAPLSITLSENSIDENSALNTTIGTFEAVDEDSGDTHTFTFASGNGSNDADNASFIIDVATLKLNTALDYESKAEYKIYTNVEDAAGESCTKAFTIIVNDIAENMPATEIILSSTSIDENKAIKTLVAELTATDTDVGDTHTFALQAADGIKDADNGSFSILGTQLVTESVFDFENKSELKINIRVTDDKSNDFDQAFTISVNDIFENSNPTAISLSKQSITENAISGILLADITATDVDPNESFTYELVVESGFNSTNNNLFAIKGSELHTTASFDYETTPELFICLKVTDSQGGSFINDFTIEVEDVDENNKPTDIQLSKYIVLADAAIGSIVANLIAVDNDVNDVHSFRLYPSNGVLDADNDKFIVDGDQLKLNADISSLSGKLNFYLRVEDQGGAIFSKAIQIEIVQEINNVAPTAINISNNEVLETKDIGFVIAEILAVDADQNDQHVFIFIENSTYPDNGSFIIQGNKLKLNTSLTYSLKNEYSIKMKATDIAGNSINEIFTINVIGNNAPTNIILSENSIVETAAIGTVIGNFTATDIDTGDTHTYTFADGGTDNASFTIDENNLKVNTALDFETKQVYSISISVSDEANASFEKEFTINIVDAFENSAPTNIELSENKISETAAIGSKIGTLTATDADADDTHTFTFANGGTDNASFTIEGANLKLNTDLDYETKSSYSIKVKVTDAANATFEKVLNISITEATGTDEISAIECKLYPNPVINILSIKCNNIASIDIYDAIGNRVLVKMNTSSTSEMKIDVSSLNSGVYFVKVKLTNNKIVTTQIVK